MTFAKYELTPEKWAELKPTIQADETYINCAVVELGHLCNQTNAEGECIQTNPLFAVDILWFEEMPESFSQYEVFPAPTGIHTFSGCDNLYAQRYCEKFPDSPHCTLPEL